MNLANFSDQELTNLKSQVSAEIEKRKPALRANKAIVIVKIDETPEGSPICLSDDCPLQKECANHDSAGDFRSEDGATPNLHKIGNQWKCEQKGTGDYGMLVNVKGRLMPLRRDC